MGALLYLALVLAPTAAFCLGFHLLDRWTGVVGRRTQPVVEDAPSRCARLGQTLHRLSAEYDRILVADVPAKATRLRALQLAYDDTLRDACRTLQLPAPPSPLDELARVQAEAELCVHGVTW